MSAQSAQTQKNSDQGKRQPLLWLFAPLAVALALTACGKDEQTAGAGAPPSVGYVTVKAQNIGLTTELPGRLQAYRVADVRARVPGVLQRRLFEEGSDVKAGQQLFQIDDAPYRASLQSAQASLAQAQANLMQTKALAERYQPLVAINAVSKQDYDNAVAAQRASEANVLAAQASVATAKINLGYAAVTAPISGRIGQAYVTEGALVGQTDITLLATVQQIDTLYVNFTQSATEVIKLQQDVRSGRYKVASDGSIPITVILDNGQPYSEPGHLMFTDWTVDETTGQVTLRATVPNPEKLLLPNLYVRVRLEQIQAENSFLVPQQAVTRAATGDTLYVVTPEDTVEPRQVVVGGRNGQNWVITSGLNDGDRGMVDGFQKWQMAVSGAMQAAAAQKSEEPVVVKVQPVPLDTQSNAAPAGNGPAAQPASGTPSADAQSPSDAAAPAAATEENKS